jgi:hypothetical protein
MIMTVSIGKETKIHGQCIVNAGIQFHKSTAIIIMFRIDPAQESLKVTTPKPSVRNAVLVSSIVLLRDNAPVSP